MHQPRRIAPFGSPDLLQLLTQLAALPAEQRALVAHLLAPPERADPSLGKLVLDDRVPQDQPRPKGEN